MAPPIERRRYKSAAFEPSETELARPGTTGVVTGLPLALLRSKHVGAVAYDLTHTYAPPAALGLVGVLTGSGLAMALALVWFAHIGMDRALGLGLLYPDGSGHTHLRGTRRDPKASSGGGLWTG